MGAFTPHEGEDYHATQDTKSGLIRVLPVLLGLSGALPAVATEYQAADYLPLAVGNSWTYSHRFKDVRGPDGKRRYGERRYGERSQWPTYTAQFPETPQFTIEVLRTEELDGQTYYVISEMPSFWPPAPPHFIAGKTLRWDGTHLMEHRSSGEQALYRFDGADETGYTVTTDVGDNLVKARLYTEPVPLHTFEFSGGPLEGGSRALGFLAGYGMVGCGWGISSDGHSLFVNRISSIRAVIGGNQIEEADAWIPTSTSSSSSTWGAVKRSLLAHRTGGGRVR